MVLGAVAPAGATIDLNSLDASAPLSAAVGITLGSNTQADQLRVLGDWDGREDLVADHARVLFDDSTTVLPTSSVLVRSGFSPYSLANGGMVNLWYTGTSQGYFIFGTEDASNVSMPGIAFTAAQFVASASNAIIGDMVSSNVSLTGIAVAPVADMGVYKAADCGITGEVIYVSFEDHDGGSNDGLGHPIHTRIFALTIAENGGGLVLDSLVQIFRHRFHNVAGLAVDDSGALYFQLVDLGGGTGGAVFKATETPVAACASSKYTFRAIAPFLLDGNLNLTDTAVDAPGVHVTNYTGTSTTFGNIVALATGYADTLYAALARSKNPADDAGTQATEGPFENPAGLGPTPSMVVSFADASGAVDTCTSPGGMQPGILPIGDGFADSTQAGVAIDPGVNNFRPFVLGNGPDFQQAVGTRRVDMQIDWSTDGYSGGLMVDEENAVYVASGAVPALVGTNPSPDRGEVLKFPDRKPFDRRADFVDLRGDTLPDPPNATADPDGDSDRFDHVFFIAPNDDGGHPTGITGLSRGFLRYLNRTPLNAITNLTPGLQGDDDHDGPIAFDDFDPSGQVAGGDDARAPNTGDDTNSGFEFSFGGVSSGMCTTPWTSFFLNSNGNVTFGAFDDANVPDIPKLLSGPPRLAPMWSDWNPSARSVNPINYPLQAVGFAAPNAFKVRWIDVPPFGFEACGGKATVAVTLYDDGTGNDESAPGTPEGPTTGTPRPDGSGYFFFDYGRVDFLGDSGQPVLVGYARGSDDLATPHVAESDWSQLAVRDPSSLLGDPTKALQFELFKDGKRPAPQVDGKVDLDLKFEGNDPAATTAATQPDPSLGTLSMHGIDCSATSLTCAYQMVIDPGAIAAASTFNQSLAVQGGEGPFTFALTSGALPTGVSLTTVTDPLTQATTALVSGGSTQAGVFNFDVTATDSNNCSVTASYSFTATCIGGATFGSLGCRIADLGVTVGALPDGKIKKKLQKGVSKASTLLGKAQEKANAQKTGPEKKLLKKVAAALKKLGKLAGSKAAKKVLSPEQIADLQARASSIQTDAIALAGSL
jgi:hypothetical protein